MRMCICVIVCCRIAKLKTRLYRIEHFQLNGSSPVFLLLEVDLQTQSRTCCTLFFPNIFHCMCSFDLGPFWRWRSGTFRLRISRKWWHIPNTIEYRMTVFALVDFRPHFERISRQIFLESHWPTREVICVGIISNTDLTFVLKHVVVTTMYVHRFLPSKIKKVIVVPPVAMMLAKLAEVERYELPLEDVHCSAAPYSAEMEELLMQRLPRTNVRQS